MPSPSPPAKAPMSASYREHLRRGNELQRAGQLEQAQHAYGQAAALEPARIEALVNRGSVLRELARHDEALACYTRAITIAPDEPAAPFNRGNLLKFMGRLDEAVADYRHALRLRPQEPSLHWNLALVLLAQGDLPAGFTEYEWRWEAPGFPGKRRHFVQPAWRGEPLEGRRLLVHGEQGHGDILQFLRFVPVLCERDVRVILEVPAALQALVKAQGFGITVVSTGATLPPFDLHVAIGSLPHRLGVDLTSLSGTPYLKPPRDRAKLLPPRRHSLRVGLVWAGNPEFPLDHLRSLQFSQLQALLELPDIEWISVQKGPAAAQVPAAAPVQVMQAQLVDWATTASLLGELDLLVSTCTAPAHLAGALGLPVWLLLGSDPDWRWLRERSDSPWYASARLFRQRSSGDWNGVVQEVALALARLRRE